MMSACTGSSEKPLAGLKIAYNVFYDTAADNYEIFVMNPDGSEKKNITNKEGVDWTYYSYKGKIYFISDRDTTQRMYFLYEMDAEGTGVRKVTDLRLEDSWMSSRNGGTELIVSGRIGREIRFQLFLIDVATGSFRQLTTDTAASYADPLFSPDGNTIYYRHRKNRRNFRNEKAEIWSMAADGSSPLQLTFFPPADTTAPWHVYHAGPPKWNSQGFISYQSIRNGDYVLMTMSPQGGEPSKINKGDLHHGWHDWSPDGQWLVTELSDREQTDYDIYLIRKEDWAMTRLTDDWRFEQSPVFVESARR
jgi:TolB protein